MRLRTAMLALYFCMLAGGLAAQPAVLVLDASASMWERQGGRSRIDAARDALAGLMARWDTARPVGLVAFGHRRSQDCADVELLAAPGPDAAAVARLARGIMPRGRTATAEALRQAAEALGGAGGSVILVSDGIDGCHPDPCAVAQQIARSGGRIVVHTIGFAISDPAAIAQLRCMAEATGGLAMTAADGIELAAALHRAAASPTPGPRAAAPRAEPVPQPRLIVTLRLCATCEAMTGDATILLRRDGELVATDGEPFGRFADLPPGPYAVSVATAQFIRGPVVATVPASGIGRATIMLDAGWLVGTAVAAPPGRDVAGEVEVTWQALSDMPEDAARHGRSQGGSAAFLLPTGIYRVAARIGGAEGAAEVAVTAGDVVLRPVPVRLGTLALRPERFGDAGLRVVVTALAGGPPVFEARLDGAPAEVALAPGAYRITVEHDGQEQASEVEIAAGSTATLTLAP
ncbi:vWA domain-containing protein [Roseomonas sp. CAU 1739]|uniref:vWA domain-containing protein n=1 Tax=Roseomonas sp. CAU 1739 TaxID=3140364 RepID=UPI00325AEA4E